MKSSKQAISNIILCHDYYSWPGENRVNDKIILNAVQYFR